MLLAGLSQRMNDEHVAMRAADHSLADAAAEQALKQARRVRADDDQVGIVVLGHLDDLVDRRAEGRSNLGGDPALFEIAASTCEQLLVLLAVALLTLDVEVDVGNRGGRQVPVRQRGRGDTVSRRS